jgi:predicted enzyme related to lactoylglutathione lyase
MASVTGFGGALVRAADPEALYRWYEQHLGLERDGGSFTFPAGAGGAPVVLALFGKDDEYFPPAQPVMLNLQVDDLDGVLDRLIDAGVPVDPRRETYDFGRFGWFTDPEGNRVELWQPVADG